ncbi:MAG: ABC transporter permease subunit [Propionibacteriaceae bacterium]|nr:ABC transporter permease subunit [Propionibacteriaceae bacterium]
MSEKTTTRKSPWSRLLILRGAVPLLVLLVFWQIFGTRNSITFPTPITWFEALYRLYNQYNLMSALGSTGIVFSISLLFVTLIGASTGMLLGASARLMRIATPTMDFFRALPSAVIVPAASLVLGVSLRSNIIVIVVSIMWPVLLNTASAMHQVPRVRFEMARSLGLKPLARLFKVVLPSVSAGIFTGVRIAVSVSMVVTLVVEMFTGTKGIGNLLYTRQQLYDSAGVWGILLLIGLIGYLLNIALNLLEAKVLHNTSPEHRSKIK